MKSMQSTQGVFENSLDSGWKSAAFEEVDTALDYEEMVENQRVVVFSISSDGFGPRAIDPTNPGIRIYGVFADRESAEDHAKLIMQAHPSCSILYCLTGQWALAASCPDSLRIQAEKVKQRLDAYYKQENKQVKEFEEVRSSKTLPDSKPDKSKKATKSSSHQGRKYNRSFVSSDMRNPMQALAVMSFVKDTVYNKDKKGECAEFIFRVHACFQDNTSADAYIRNHASKDIQDFDLHIVSMNEWLHPQSVNEMSIQSVYRDKELSAIVQSAKTSKRRVKDYERIFLKNSEPPPTSTSTTDTNDHITEPATEQATEQAMEQAMEQATEPATEPDASMDVSP